MEHTEELAADFRGTHVTTGPHPVSFHRAELDRRGILSAAALARAKDGKRVQVAGVVIVRQRPGTAKGLVFITLEDETGFANAVVMPDVYQQWRKTLLGHVALVIGGKVQNRDGVVTLLAESFAPMPEHAIDTDLSRNFH